MFSLKYSKALSEIFMIIPSMLTHPLTLNYGFFDLILPSPPWIGWIGLLLDKVGEKFSSYNLSISGACILEY